MNKQILLGLSACSLTLAASAQWLVPNEGFENWTASSNYEEPLNWHTANPFGSGLNVITASKDSISKHGGNYSLKLESKTVALLSLTIPGVATTGDISINMQGSFTIKKGFPFTASPTALTAYYRYAPMAQDSFEISVLLTKWNTSNNKRDTVATGRYASKSPQSSFAMLSVPVTYALTGVDPDSANIIIMSDQIGYAMAGTTLNIDDIAFTGGNVGFRYLADILAETHAYPNPANSEVTLSLPSHAGKMKVSVFNAIGVKVKEFDTENTFSKIDVTSFPQGLYLYQIADMKNNILSAGKLTVN